jgi:hypothetical protein
LFLQIIQAGIILVTLIDERVYSADGINANPYELLISLVAMMRANEESAHESIRLRKAWRAKRARAHVKPLTARCPEWLRLDRTTGTFEILPDRAETVRRIFREALSGKGHVTITKILNREEVPLLSGRDFADAHWQSARVNRILMSPSVIGTLIPHKTEYQNGKRVYRDLAPIVNYYPAVIDPDEFARVLEIRKKNAARQAMKSPARRQGNIFARLAQCPLCKGSMRLIVCTQPHWRYLVCSRAFLRAGCVRRGDAELDRLVNERSTLCATEPSLAHLHLDRRLSELQRTAQSFDTDRWSMNAALRALFVSIEIDYPRNTLRLEWRHGGKTNVRLDPDVMAMKDGWTPTTTVPALRRLHPRRRRQTWCAHTKTSAEPSAPSGR